MERRSLYFNSVSDISFDSKELPLKGTEIVLHIIDDKVGLVDITFTKPSIMTRDDPKPAIQPFLDEIVKNGVDVIRVIPDEQSSRWRIELCKDAVPDIIRCDIDYKRNTGDN